MRILGQARQGLLSDDAELAARLSVGMVFQNGALFDSLTVGENVGFLLYEHTRLADRRIRVCDAFRLCACLQEGGVTIIYRDEHCHDQQALLIQKSLCVWVRC